MLRLHIDSGDYGGLAFSRYSAPAVFTLASSSGTLLPGGTLSPPRCRMSVWMGADTPDSVSELLHAESCQDRVVAHLNLYSNLTWTSIIVTLIMGFGSRMIVKRIMEGRSYAGSTSLARPRLRVFPCWRR